MALIQPNIPEMEAPPPLEAGVVNEPMGDLPTEGGVESVEDDIPTTAKEGDFILPYESVLYVGLNNINIEVKKAMKQAQQEGVQIEGADPDSDIPIKISNFEYRIPKELVEYIGIQRLETYREKGLELRAQLEKNRGDKEKAFVPPPQEPQQMAQAAMPPMQIPQEQAMPPMMQMGGMVAKPSGETLHSPTQGSPLQSPSPMQQKKKEEKELLDMSEGGLVKKKELNEGGRVRAEEIKTLVEGGHDVEFMMNVEPYIKNDMLAQYGSEIKEPMMDPKAKPKDMFSTANIRLGDRRRLAGSYLGDRSQNMKEAGDIIKEIKRQGRENEPDSVEFIKEYNRRKAQTPYDRVEERAKLGEKGLRDKPESFMPAKDASFVSLRQSDHIIGTDSILDSEGNPHLTDPVNTAVTFIHEARHKAVQKLNLRPLINKTLDHILNVEGGAEEVLMRFMDYKNATTPEEKVNQKKWVINFYDMLNNVAKNKGLRIRFTDPFQDTTKGEQEFEKLDQLSSLVNTVAKEKLEELRGVPVYEDKDYPESLLEQIDRKGIFATMFPYHFVSKEKK